MNKAELVRAVAAKTKLGESQVKSAIETALDEIVLQVRGGGEVRIIEFGTFKRVAQSARKGINPITKERIDIPARNAIKFKPVSAVSAMMG